MQYQEVEKDGREPVVPTTDPSAVVTQPTTAETTSLPGLPRPNGPSKLARRFAEGIGPLHLHYFKHLKVALEHGHDEDRAVRSLVEKMVERTQFKRPLDIYPHERLESSANFGAILAAPSKERLGLVAAVCSIPLERNRLTPATRSNLLKILIRTTPEERLKLCRFAGDLAAKDKSLRHQCASIATLALQSSKDLKELRQLANATGKTHLLSLKSPIIREILAIAVVGHELSRAPIPKRPKPCSPTNAVNQTLDQIKAAVQARLELCEIDPRFTKTKFVKRMVAALEGDLEYLADERVRLKVRRTDSGRAVNLKERRELANTYITLLRTQYRHMLDITASRDDDGRLTVRWNDAPAREVQETLRRFPARPLLFTPKLSKIELAPKLEDALGEVDHHGVVWISEEGVIKNCDFKKEYRRQPPLRVLLIHELGHLVKYGAGHRGKCGKESKRDACRHTDPIWDFDDFMDLASWDVISPKKFKLDDGGHSVQIEGQHYALGSPVSIKGEEVILKYQNDTKTLFVHSAKARFPTNDNSRNDPYEHWTEALTEYLLIPKRLIRDDLASFVYFENHLGMYADKEAVQEAARARANALYRVEEPPEQEARLTPVPKEVNDETTVSTNDQGVRPEQSEDRK